MSVFTYFFRLSINLKSSNFSVVKPLLVDDTAQSHALSLAFDESCLTEVSPPVVLQEFVNHGNSLLLFELILAA